MCLGTPVYIGESCEGFLYVSFFPQKESLVNFFSIIELNLITFYLIALILVGTVFFDGKDGGKG